MLFAHENSLEFLSNAFEINRLLAKQFSFVFKFFKEILLFLSNILNLYKFLS